MSECKVENVHYVFMYLSEPVYNNTRFQYDVL